MAKQSSGTGKGGKSFQDRELAASVRSLALTQIKEILEGNSKEYKDDKEFKKALILKLSTNILPRLNEHSGPDGEGIKTIIIQKASEHRKDTTAS
ncbi:hypothetical protein [Amorphus orientalis]|uniref:Uncharacterized protein n=1 Tax=Amorphus orientalis TaxID=649198 RepID=A0AAE3VQC8_9HYPH|nr:hypothetical protein [Amorphus orientalis]MDQ0316412.1 hypothetical protein [Amorphus orientalis]